MLKKLTMALVVTSSYLCIHSAIADGFSGHIQMGAAWPSFQGTTQDIAVYPDTTNEYSVNTPNQTKPLYGAGLAYQWNYQHLAFNFGLSTYYLQSTVSGVNAPFVNGGTFDTLNYITQGHSNVWMLEPKLIWTDYAWQPYILTGFGISTNNFGNYSESKTNPESSAVPTSTPFNGKSTQNFAYECALGLQHTIGTSKNAPILALDYRFMDLGNAGLNTYTDQPTNDSLSFGHLHVQSVNLSLIWPF